MNKIRFVKIEDLLDKKEKFTIKKLNSKEYLKVGKYPIVDQGQKSIVGYHNNKEFLYNGKLPVVIFGDHTLNVKYIDFPFIQGADGLKIFIPIENIDVKFFAYLIDYIKPNGNSYRRHFTLLKDLKIPIPYKDNKPDLETQKRIVEKLELAEKLKENRNKADELTKEYLNAVFLDMFGDPRTNPKGFEVKNLFKISEITMGQSPAGKSYNNGGMGIPFFQGKAEFGEKYTITKKWTTEPTKLAKKDDILMSVRAPVGTVNLSSVDCCIGRGLASIKPNENIIRLKFLFNFFRLNESYIKSLGEGSTFKAITSQQLKNLEIPIPPIELQNQFAQVVEQVEQLKEYQNKSKEEIDNLFNVLMQQAFRGEL